MEHRPSRPPTGSRSRTGSLEHNVSDRLPLSRAAALVALFVLALPVTAHAWGAATHHYIAQHWSQDLPGTIDGLRFYDAVVDSHVTDPDTRKSSTPGESYKHYIDIDVYPEFLAGTLTHSRSALEAQYGASTVLANGVLPWAINDATTQLATQFAAAQWSAAALTIADLCHYAGDETQPLHCTANYDGAQTGNSGIHSRYETTMMSAHLAECSTPVIASRVYTNVTDAMFKAIGESWACVSGLLAADNAAKTASGGSYSTTYYNALWSATKAMTQARLDSATVMTASLVHTAWMNAGRPVVPGSTVGVPLVPPGPVALRLAAGPSPFRGALGIRWAGEGPLAIDVYDVRGAHVDHVADGLRGSGLLVWAPAAAGARAPAGVYFVHLTSPDGAVTRRVTRVE